MSPEFCTYNGPTPSVGKLGEEGICEQSIVWALGIEAMNGFLIYGAWEMAGLFPLGFKNGGSVFSRWVLTVTTTQGSPHHSVLSRLPWKTKFKSLLRDTCDPTACLPLCHQLEHFTKKTIGYSELTWWPGHVTRLIWFHQWRLKTGFLFTLTQYWLILHMVLSVQAPG